MIRIFFFLFGFGIMTIGFIYTILYLNVLSLGYNFSYYVNLIIRRFECYLTVLGFIIMNLSIYVKGDNKYGICL